MSNALLIIGIIILVIVAGSFLMGVVGGLIGWLIIGLIAGLLANALMKGGSRDLFSNLGLGLVGSVLSGFVLNIIGLGRLDNNIIGNLVFATLGAMLLIGLGRMFNFNKRGMPRM